MVHRGNAKADEKAEQILAGMPKRPGEDVMKSLMRMANEMSRAEDLEDKDLTNEVFREVWGVLDMDGRPSAVLEEMIRRFKEHTGQPVPKDED